MLSKSAIVWGQNRCKYCDLAIKHLENLGVNVTYYKIGVNVTENDFYSKFPGVRSVPQIEIDGKHIGGYTELLSASI